MIDNYVEFRQIAKILTRWWWVLLLGLLAGAVIGYGISQRQPRVYEAHATVIVGESIQASQISRDDIAARDAFMETYADLARRQPILDRVIQTLNLNISMSQLKDRVQVDIVQPQFIEITVQANNPQEAQSIAGEIVHQLTLLSPEPDAKDSTQLFLQKEIESLQIRIESGRKKLLALQAQTTNNMPTDQLATPTDQLAVPTDQLAVPTYQPAALNNEITTLERLITDWEDTYSRLLGLLEPNSSQNRLAILEKAQANPKPVQPNPPLNILLGLGLGFVVALGVIFLLDQFDNKIRSAEVLERKLGLNYLGSINKIHGEKFAGNLITLQDPLSTISESYRMIKRNIEFNADGRDRKFLLITSPGEGDGKSITVSNLGIVMAQAGLKTIIVDADFRESKQHIIFNVPNGIGLSDLLTTLNLKPKEQLIDTGVENLRLLTSGNLPHNPAELLNPGKVRSLLSDLSNFSDVVLLDVSSMANAETMELASLVDGVVLVIDIDRTTRASVQKSIAKLHLTNSRLLGGMLNRSHP